MVLPFRTGFGFDVHRLVEGRDLWIGGVKIEHSLGLLGHSDATWQSTRSAMQCSELRRCATSVSTSPTPTLPTKASTARSCSDAWPTCCGKKATPLENADITICAEAPKMNPHIPAMQKAMAECIGCDPDDISVKATTTERLGFTGRQEGISAYATVLIARN